MEIVATYLEAEFDRMIFQALMEGLAVEIAGALVEQVCSKMGCAGLIRLVLRGAAMKRVV